MNKAVYMDHLGSRGLGAGEIERSVRSVMDLEDYLSNIDADIEEMDVKLMRGYLSHLIEVKANSMQRLVDLARYFYSTGQHSIYIYLVSTFSGREVLDSISDKIISEMGTDCRTRIFEGLEKPPLGSPPESYIENTMTMVERLLDEGVDRCHEILADNHHGIPRDSFSRFVEMYRDSDSLDDFLARLHRERVGELQRHSEQGKAWFEQEITPEVVDMVRENREMLSAVRKGDHLYITKIPYAPAQWLSEQDPGRRRYLACHCPLAREAILSEEVDIPMDWCYCSGGFAKRLFDVLFNEFTEVEVLESVLAGDDRCRFRIRLP